jgi:hypothetical protein
MNYIPMIPQKEYEPIRCNHSIQDAALSIPMDETKNDSFTLHIFKMGPFLPLFINEDYPLSLCSM